MWGGVKNLLSEDTVRRYADSDLEDDNEYMITSTPNTTRKKQKAPENNNNTVGSS